MNLFLATRRLTTQREDHVTEFFAAALREDPLLRHAFEDLVIAPFARRNGWPASPIASIETQVSYRDGACRPDMRVTRADGGTCLLVRVTPGAGHPATTLAERLANLDVAQTYDLVPEIVTVPRAEGPRDVIDVGIGLHRLLGDAHTAEGIEARGVRPALP